MSSTSRKQQLLGEHRDIKLLQIDLLLWSILSLYFSELVVWRLQEMREESGVMCSIL